MLAAVALVAYLVQPGDTLSGIAASHGVSLASVEAANSSLANPNLIHSGQTIQIPEGSPAHQGPSATRTAAGSGTPRTAQSTASVKPGTAKSGSAGGATKSSGSGSSGYSASDLSDIPGVPSSFASCVAYRESTDLKNPAAEGNAYGIIAASGYHVYGTSLANQKRVFAELYAEYGTSPWSADGCAG